MLVPNRCRVCANWLGHLSGRAGDTRCNRNWGHDEAVGKLYDPAMPGALTWSKPAYVRLDCQVPADDTGSIPSIDEWGNVTGPPGKPKWIDAFMPIAGREGEGELRSVPVKFVTPYGDAVFTSEDLQDYLTMATPAQRKRLIESANARTGNRTQMQKQHSKHYEKKHHAAPKVLTGSQALPPWERGLEKVATGLAPLDVALKGGIPVGTRLNVSGTPDAGKSSLVNRIEGAFIRYYVENARSFYDTLVAGGDLTQEEADEIISQERIGLIKPESFELDYMVKAYGLEGFEGKTSQEVFDSYCDILATNFAEESMQYVVSALNADNASLSEFRDANTYSYMIPNQYRLFTFDSIDAEELASESFGKNDSESMIGDNHRIAGGARLLSEFFRKGYKAKKIPVTLILVSQQRMTNLATQAKSSPHRGKAHPYFTTLEFNLWSPKMGEGATTKEVIIKFGKVHVDAAIKSGDQISIFLRPGKGFTKIDNCVPVAFDLGVLRKSGSWVYYITSAGVEMKNQGADPGKVADWLDSHGLADELYNRTMEAAGLEGGSSSGTIDLGVIEEAIKDVTVAMEKEHNPPLIGLPRL